MRVSLILLLAALAGLAAAALVPGLSDLVLVALPCALACLWLMLRAARPAPTQPWVVIDGSNVMHWQGGTPAIAPLREVIAHLTARGMTPCVVFDANAGYLVAGQFQDDAALARMLGLPASRVLVVPKGQPADPTILSTALRHSARIVSNDRYRDWADRHPEVADPGHLIRGGYRDGVLWMTVDGQMRPQAAA